MNDRLTNRQRFHVAIATLFVVVVVFAAMIAWSEAADATTEVCYDEVTEQYWEKQQRMVEEDGTEYWVVYADGALNPGWQGPGYEPPVAPEGYRYAVTNERTVQGDEKPCPTTTTTAPPTTTTTEQPTTTTIITRECEGPDGSRWDYNDPTDRICDAPPVTIPEQPVPETSSTSIVAPQPTQPQEQGTSTTRRTLPNTGAGQIISLVTTGLLSIAGGWKLNRISRKNS